MQAIVAHLLVDEFKHVSDVTPFYDVSASWQGEAPSPTLMEKFEATGRRCWNTHLLWSLLPKDDGPRYIYVTRDGRDAVVSFWHHLTNQRGDAGTLDEPIGSFVDGVISGTQPYGSWASHIADWSTAFEDPRVLAISYEEMKADLHAVVQRVANHIGADQSRVEAVAARCTFEQASMIIQPPRYNIHLTAFSDQPAFHNYSLLGAQRICHKFTQVWMFMRRCGKKKCCTNRSQ